MFLKSMVPARCSIAMTSTRVLDCGRPRRLECPRLDAASLKSKTIPAGLRPDPLGCLSQGRGQIATVGFSFADQCKAAKPRIDAEIGQGVGSNNGLDLEVEITWFRCFVGTDQLRIDDTG